MTTALPQGYGPSAPAPQQQAPVMQLPPGGYTAPPPRPPQPMLTQTTPGAAPTGALASALQASYGANYAANAPAGALGYGQNAQRGFGPQWQPPPQPQGGGYTPPAPTGAPAGYAGQAPAGYAGQAPVGGRQLGAAPMGPQLSQQPTQAPAAAPQPTGSLEQRALAGGSNAQQTQNFLAALRQAGAGGNNAAQASSAPAASPLAPLLGAPAQGNGSAGSMSTQAVGNQGLGQVSYNQGLGATGGNVQWTPLAGATGGPSSSGTLAPTAANQTPIVPGLTNPGSQGYNFNAPGSTPLAGQPGGGYSSSYGPSWSQGTAPASAGNVNTGGGSAGTTLGGQVIGPGADAWRAQQQQQAIQNAAPTAGLTPFIPSTSPQAPQGQAQQAYTPNYGGAQALMSDERSKESVRGAGKPLKSFLDAIGAHSYEYKDPSNGVGRFVSPMAQELERTELGKSAVETGADGMKRVQYGRLIGVSLAGLSDVHKRLKKLERKGR